MKKSAARLTIGLDYGSDSARAVVVDCTSGEEIATAVAAYPRWSKGLYCVPSRQQFRQHPQDYLDVLQKTIRAVVQQIGAEQSAHIIGIGIDTTGSTPVALDAQARPLALDPAFADDPDAMFILWKDHTAVAEAEEFNALCHGGTQIDVTRYCGGTYSSEWWWAKIAHIMRHNKKVAKAAVSWAEHCDWLPAELCGVTSPLQMARSRCAAGHKACWHPSWGGLPPEKLLTTFEPRLAGLRATFAAETSTVDQAAGYLSANWAKRLGLPAGIAVAVGAFDAHLGAVGAGAKDHILTKVMGTSTCDMVTVGAATLGDTCVRGICGQVDGSIIPGRIGLEAGQSAFGDVFAWYAQQLAWAMPKGKDNINNIIARLSAAAEQVPAGSSGITALDWINGRRTPGANQRVSAAISGLQLGHGAPEIFRALVEATAFGARAVIERFEEEGVRIDGVLALGGIARKSPFIMQVCADVMSRPIAVVDSDQCCAKGAAIAAAVAAKAYSSIPAAVKKMAAGVEQRYKPQGKTSRLYNTLYADYQSLGQWMEQRSAP